MSYNKQNLLLLRVGDRTTLAEVNMDLVVRMAKTYVKNKYNGTDPKNAFEELKSLGYLALVKAAKAMPVTCKIHVVI